MLILLGEGMSDLVSAKNVSTGNKKAPQRREASLRRFPKMSDERL